MLQVVILTCYHNLLAKKTSCYCETNDLYDCYKELLGPIYPGQTITISLINSHNTHGLEAYQTDDVVVDTSLPTACVVTDPSEIQQPIKHNQCIELKYSIAFPSDEWCELYLKTFLTIFTISIFIMSLNFLVQLDSSKPKVNVSVTHLLQSIT